MSDREKVIKALECRKNADKRCGNPCEDTGICHYRRAVRGLDGEFYIPFICDEERIYADALALLKEQEPVEPKEIINDFYPVEDYRRTLGWQCGKCGRTLKGDADFCSYCGQAVKWE